VHGADKREDGAAGVWTARELRAWQGLLEHLREELPPEKPVRVWRTKRAPLRYYGTVADHSTHHHVEIARRLDFSQAVYALEEEWSHCLSGYTGDEPTDHGMEWGLAMSAVRKTILEHREEEGW